jgi:hypothetical protein
MIFRISATSHGTRVNFFVFVSLWLDFAVSSQTQKKTLMPLSVEKKDLSGLTVLITGANVGEYKQPINVQPIPA